jgi:uncharacterized SAM-binding protein YcdF (DUF218 family)
MPSPGEAIASRQKSRHSVRVLLAVLLIGFLGYIAWLSTTIASYASIDETRNADVIVVLGAAEYSGHPSPAFRLRLDHAAELFKHGYAPLIIVSGGAGGETSYNEGQVGRDYLITRGVPEEKMIAETHSASTLESSRRVTAIMRENGMKTCLAVSDGYHLYRTTRMLRAQGVTVYAAPRPDQHGHPLYVLDEAFKYLAWQLHLE